MSTVILTGHAVVAFRKVIRGCSPEDVESLREVDNQECNIDDDDLGEIVQINSIEMEVRE